MTQPTPKQQHQMTPEKARETILDCVCSDCYDQLTEKYDWRTRTSQVTCITPGCETPGFVTRKWVEKQREQNRAEAHEARNVLQQAAPWMKPEKKTSEQLLKELGF